MTAQGLRFALGAASLLAATVVADDAGAQTAADKVMAETLFAEGRGLMARGRVTEACPKFAASQRLDPGLGTLLNLGDCYERIGKTATAWALFREAASLASASGDQRRAAEAWKRATALDRRLSKLTIVAPPQVPSGLVVRRGASVVASELLGIPIPVDPGTHVVEATAPGRIAWRALVEVRGDAAQATVQIENLEPDSARGRTQRSAALVAGGLGVVGVLGGGLLALRAASKWHDAQRCEADASCTVGSAQDMANEARTGTKVAAVVLGVGTVGLAAGGVLWLTAPAARGQPTSTSWSVAPSASFDVAGLCLRGGF